MKRNRRNGIKIAAAVAAYSCAAAVSVVHYLLQYAIGRSGDGGVRKVALNVDSVKGETERIQGLNCERQRKLTEAFTGRIRERQAEIVSCDGLTLRGGYYEQKDSHLWAVIIHGYRSRHRSMLNFAQRYYDAGYQVLLPDLRACGESEGRFLGMGWLDRKDMLGWIDWILQKDADAKIVLHGASMGGATVMMTSGEQTPDAVRAFVEDCGYTSAWDMFSSELRLRFHLPEFPVLYLASGIARLRAGYGLKTASSLEQVKKCQKPMLFIHGTQDDFVPFEMLDVLYQAKPGTKKQKLKAEGAGHGEAAKTLGDKYWESVFAFITPYMTS
ncbi:MAG: alpha/beta hydrolase [Lachnospiraceae bacterium]|nr:alpha/beta hydrolase [Lachnospiraceae bacterium]